MKLYCRCGKYCGTAAKGSKLLKGLKVCCTNCEIKTEAEALRDRKMLESVAERCDIKSAMRSFFYND